MFLLRSRAVFVVREAFLYSLITFFRDFFTRVNIKYVEELVQAHAGSTETVAS